MKSYLSHLDLFTVTRYPAGERHHALRGEIPLNGGEVVEYRARNFEDLADLVVMDRILKRVKKSVRWFVPYFPFGRHDRRNHTGDGFELGLALELLRDVDVVTADPHSDVSGQLPHVPQAAVVNQLRRRGELPEGAVFLVPDAGAARKADSWRGEEPMIQAMKHRDPATGSLSGFRIMAEDLGGAPCVIVDDICDGGGTFLGLAEALSEKNAGPLHLVVTHGLFTKGFETLLTAFETITTFYYLDQTPAGPNGLCWIKFEDLYTKGIIQ